jgi:hypothetical protein
MERTGANVTPIIEVPRAGHEACLSHIRGRIGARKSPVDNLIRGSRFHAKADLRAAAAMAA